MTITERSSDRTRWTKTTKDVPVPEGMPDFQEEDQVRFTIGNKGQLTGPGFSIKYRSSEDNVNFYAKSPSSTSNKGDAATVTKTNSHRPKSATLTFYKYRFSGIVPIVNTVYYELKRNP